MSQQLMEEPQMATITISDKNYQDLVQRAKILNSSPEAILNELLETFLETLMTPAHIVSQTETVAPPIKTLGDLLAYGYGLWADRNDIEDPVLYATQLREEAWQRNL
jgi:hypothetical protein